MAKKQKIPPAFHVREPSRHYDPGTPTVEPMDIYCDAFKTEAFMDVPESGRTEERLMRSARKTVDKLLKMQDDYFDLLRHTGVLVPTKELDEWPLIAVDLPPGLTGAILVKMLDNITPTPANTALLKKVLIPPVNRGHVSVFDCVHIFYEVLDTDPEDFSYTLRLHLYDDMPYPVVDEDTGHIIDGPTLPERLTPVALTDLRIHVLETEDGTGYTAEVEALRNITGPEILSSLRPKVLGWDRRQVRLWEKTKLQTAVDSQKAYEQTRGLCNEDIGFALMTIFTLCISGFDSENSILDIGANRAIELNVTQNKDTRTLHIDLPGTGAIHYEITGLDIDANNTLDDLRPVEIPMLSCSLDSAASARRSEQSQPLPSQPVRLDGKSPVDSPVDKLEDLLSKLSMPQPQEESPWI